MFKNIVFFVSMFMFLTSVDVFAKENYFYTVPQSQNEVNLQGYALYVPAGVSLSVVLSNEINSQSSVVGSVVNAALIEDFVYNGTTIATAGSVINGSVVAVQKAGFANRNAKMQIRFTTIRTPYNNIIPISATISTDDLTGVLKGGTTKDSAIEYAKDTAIGAGSGAVLGTAMGALSGGSVGRGAIYGTALGAGMGVIKGISEKGESILIPANSEIKIYFDQPITMGAQ